MEPLDQRGKVSHEHDYYYGYAPTYTDLFTLYSPHQVYQFPECDSDEDEDFKQQDRELKAAAPFAVVAADTVLEVGGKRVRGRQYPWGIVDGES